METLGDETSQKLDPEALSTESDEVVENAGSCSESVVQHDHTSKAKNSQKSSGFSAPIRKSSSDSQKLVGGDISDDNNNEKSSKTTEETEKKKKQGPKPKQNQLNSQKFTGKAVIPIRALTDDEYEDIFSAVLKRMEVDTVNEVSNLEETSTETVNDKDDVKDDFEELLKVEDNFTDKIFDEKQNEEMSADTKNGNVEADVNDADNVSDREAGDEEAQDDQPVEDGVAENQGVYDPDVDESMVNEDLKTPNISNDNLKRICTPKRPAKSSSKKKTGSKQKIARKESNAERTPRKLDFQHSKNAKGISKKESKERKPKGKKTKKSKREKFAEREIEQSEIWVQCSNTYCLKWRKCLNVTDASRIPDNWECHMNADERYNSCMVPQQKIEEPDEDHEFVFTRYNIGSLVWARMQGFPWWPGMLEEDPDTECFYETDGASLYPKKYHVVFFGDKVSRAWVSSNNVEAFTGAEEIEDFGQTKLKGKNYMKELVKAKEEGMKALEMSVKERISMYGFSKRYKGSWGADFSGSQTLSQESGEAEGEMGAHSSGSRESSQVSLVHEILSNAESVLNEAETVLNELEGSMQDLDTDSDFQPESPKKKKNSKKRKIREDKENEKENKTEEMESQPRKRKVEKSVSGEKAKKKKLQEGNDVQDEENAKSMEKEPDKVVQSESDGRVKTEEKPKLKKGKKKNEEKKVSQKKCNSDSIEQVPRNKDNKGKKGCVEERKQNKTLELDDEEKAKKAKKSKPSFKVPGKQKAGKVEGVKKSKTQEQSSMDGDVFTMELESESTSVTEDKQKSGGDEKNHLSSADESTSGHDLDSNGINPVKSSVKSTPKPTDSKAVPIPKCNTKKTVGSKPKFSVKRKKVQDVKEVGSSKEETQGTEVAMTKAGESNEGSTVKDDSQDFDLEFDDVNDIPADTSSVVTDQLNQKVIDDDNDSQPFEIEP